MNKIELMRTKFESDMKNLEPKSDSLTIDFLSNTNNFDMERVEIKNTFKILKELPVAFAKIETQINKPKVKIETITKQHKILFSLFQKAIEGIDMLKKQMNEKLHSNDFDEKLLYKTISIEDSLRASFKEANNILLTYRPTAKIAYGKRCIEDVITTSDEEKVKKILTNYKGLRKVRGDGNCFLSSFITGLLENYAQHKKLADLVNLVENDKLEQSPLTKTVFYQTMLSPLKKEVTEIFQSIQKDPSKIQRILADNEKILPLIKYFRILAADEMITKQDQFEWNLRSDVESVFQETQEIKPYEDLISEYILKMGVDFSHPSILALCQRLNFCVKIIDLKIGAKQGLCILDAQKPQATFCRDGEHYFVLYERDEMEQIKSSAPLLILNNDKSDQGGIFLIECKHKLPFGCSLFVRGSGNGLNWDKGTELKNIENVWMFESSKPLEKGECKFLLNDDIKYWEKGNNRKIEGGNLINNAPANFENLLEISTQFEFDENKYSLAICGSGIDGVSDWDPHNLIYLSKENGMWSTQILQKENSTPILFKYVLIERGSGKKPLWETTPNRKIGDNYLPVFK